MSFTQTIKAYPVNAALTGISFVGLVILFFAAL